MGSSTGSPCCGGCPPGESAFSDDFSGYSDGQLLLGDSFGYVGATGARMVAESGRARLTLTNLSLGASVVSRPYPFDPESSVSVEFSLEIFSQVTHYGELFIWKENPAAQVSLQCGLAWYYFGGTNYQIFCYTRQANGAGNQSNHSHRVISGDVLSILVEKDAYTAPDLESTVTFAVNGSTLASRSSFNSSADWCNVDYGFRFPHDTVIDNWNFSRL